jgi:hypothetical protein
MDYNQLNGYMTRSRPNIGFPVLPFSRVATCCIEIKITQIVKKKIDWSIVKVNPLEDDGGKEERNKP